MRAIHTIIPETEDQRWQRIQRTVPQGERFRAFYGDRVQRDPPPPRPTVRDQIYNHDWGDRVYVDYGDQVMISDTTFRHLEPDALAQVVLEAGRLFGQRVIGWFIRDHNQMPSRIDIWDARTGTDPYTGSMIVGFRARLYR